MDESQTPGNRRSRRSNVLLSATIEVGGAAMPVKLRNLSEQGALVEGAKLPVEGSELLFRRNDLTVKGRIAWVSGAQAGIAVSESLSQQEVLRNIPQPKPRVQPDCKRPALQARTLTVAEQVAMEHWLSIMPSKRD